MGNLMIKVNNVTKQYKLGQIGGTTLREELQKKHAKLHGKEDPTKKIGAREYTSGESFMALNGISFEVNKGDRVGIIGHNGAGKSTLLKLLSRITAPTSGEIGLNGRVASMLEVGTGFHGELTGRENIYMNGAILGMTKREIDEKIEDIIEFSECRQFIDTPVKRYSSGMYVKLAFSVAAHLDSEIMIMDEVLAVGDMAFQKKCLDKMNEVSKQEGRTILYVSHNMNTIRQLCERVIVLDHGMIIFDGDVEGGIEIYDHEYNTEKLDVVYDCREYPRKNSLGTVMSFEEVCFLQKESAEFSNKEQIQMSVRIRAVKPMPEVRVSVIVKDKNNAGILFSGVSEAFHISEGNENSMVVEVPLSLLESGLYMIHTELVSFNETGGMTVYDNPFHAFPVSVTKDDDLFIWPKKYYGAVRLKDYSCHRL